MMNTPSTCRPWSRSRGHGRAADDDAGDAVHFLTGAGAEGDGGVGRGVEDGGHADEEAGERVDGDLQRSTLMPDRRVASSFEPMAKA